MVDVGLGANLSFRQNLRPPQPFFECRNCGVKDPWQITPDKLKTEFFVCKHNINLLQANSPHLQLKFLKNLVTKAKTRGDITRASKVTGIIQKEASRKQWRQINWSTRKAHGSLMVAVKVSTVDGGQQIQDQGRRVQSGHPHTPRMVPVSAGGTMPPRDLFQGCRPSGRWTRGSTILDSTYVYPPDLDPATRLLFEEALATYAALSPTTIATYVTPEDFQHSWQLQGSGLACPTAGCTLATILGPLTALISCYCMRPNFQCALGTKCC
jgi:hypothetical protein